MLDYIFFDTKLSNKFKNHLRKAGIEFEYKQDSMFGSVQGEIVSIDEMVSETILYELQNLYDELQNELEKLLEESNNNE